MKYSSAVGKPYLKVIRPSYEKITEEMQRWEFLRLRMQTKFWAFGLAGRVCMDVVKASGPGREGRLSGPRSYGLSCQAFEDSAEQPH